MKIGILVNPKARKVREGKIKKQDLEKIVSEIKEINDDNDKVIKEFQDKGVDVLGIIGGDGTLHLTLTFLLNNYPDYFSKLKYLFLEGGTHNNIIKNLKIKGNLYKSLKNVVDCSYKEIYVRPLRIGCNGNTFCGFIFSGLTIAKFAEKYYNQNYSAFGVKKPSVIKTITFMIENIFSALVGGKTYNEINQAKNIEIYLYRKDEDKIFENFKFLGEKHNAFVVTSLPLKFLGLNIFKNKDKNELGIAGGYITKKVIFSNAIIPRVWLGLPLKYLYQERGEYVYLKSKDDFKFFIDGEVYNGKKNNVMSIYLGNDLKVISPFS